MSTLTAGADLAWKLAAAEAVAGGHPRIENAHLFAGVLSLENVEGAPSELALAPGSDVWLLVKANAFRFAG